MSKFDREAKASRQEARQTLSALIEGFMDVYHIAFTSDSGGAVMELYIEMEDTHQHPTEQYPLFPINEISPKWMGWRICVIKVPPDAIDGLVIRKTYDG